jgi:hypothetical protein
MFNASMIIAQSSDTGDAAAGVGAIIAAVIYLAIIVVVIAGMWKMLEKANQPGWGILIPIYNVILLLRVAGKPIWWIVLMIIPLVNIVPAILLPMAIARSFGKGTGFGIGLIFLPFIFYPMLGFGQAEYSPPGLPAV